MVRPGSRSTADWSTSIIRQGDLWGRSCPTMSMRLRSYSEGHPGMNRLVFLKLGGSALTNKTEVESLDTDLLGQLARAIANTLHADPGLRLLIGHGGGSFGHYWAQRYQTHRGAHDTHGWEGVARVADAMGRLNRAVVKELLATDVRAISIQPSASAIAGGGTLQTMTVAPLVALLHAGMVPVVFGDVVVDTEQGAAILSTEALFEYMMPILQPDGIVLVGESAVFTADPHKDPTAERIPIIDESNIVQVLHGTGGAHGIDVTGGMAAKLQTMWRLVAAHDSLTIYLVDADPAR